MYWWLRCKEQNFLFYHVTAYYRLTGRNTFLHQDEFRAPENLLGWSSSCLLLPLILAERPLGDRKRKMRKQNDKYVTRVIWSSLFLSLGYVYSKCSKCSKYRKCSKCL